MNYILAFTNCLSNHGRNRVLFGVPGEKRCTKLYYKSSMGMAEGADRIMTLPMFATMLSNSHASSHFPTTLLCRNYYYPHFTDQKRTQPTWNPLPKVIQVGSVREAIWTLWFLASEPHPLTTVGHGSTQGYRLFTKVTISTKYHKHSMIWWMPLDLKKQASLILKS